MAAPVRLRTNDDETVRAAIAGDRAALDRVVDLWLPTVYGWCGRLGAGIVDPEEAAHDVMMVLVRRHATIQGPDKLGPWLFGSCRRVVSNHRQRAWWRRWLPGAGVEWRAASNRTDEGLEQRELADEVERVLARLAPTHREVLVLCYLEERSVAEAAALLDIPSGTVKSRLFHARDRFRSLFEALDGAVSPGKRS